MDDHRAILEDYLVGDLLSRANEVFRRRLPVDIDRRGLGAHMKGPCFRSASTNKSLRQNVLAAMLLQVIEPPRGIDFAGHLRTDRQRTRAGHFVINRTRLILEHVGDFYTGQRPEIVRLTSAGWIKRRPIENYRITAVG